MSPEGEGPGEYLLDGKCKYCGREQGHAHDCPIFEHSLYQKNKEVAKREWHQQQGEERPLSDAERARVPSIQDQVHAIEQDIKAGPPETRKSAGRASIRPPHLEMGSIDKGSQQMEELHQRILECHTLASGVLTSENKNFLDAHRELSEASEEYDKIDASYQLFLSSYDSQKETDPVFFAHYSDKTSELKEDLLYLKSLFARYRREYS